MSYMFENCSSLFYFSNNWNTNYITNMSYMFKDCILLKNIFGISKWNTNNVISMEGMFFIIVLNYQNYQIFQNGIHQKFKL